MGARKHLVVIAGPTAIGKTALAIQVAEFFQTDIVSADSRQFYCEMSIGTAKPSEAELARVPHHFINSHHLADSFTVGDYEQEALAVLERIYQRNDVAVLAGGSGLFINAITKGFDDLPKAPAEVREELNGLLRREGIMALQEKLKELDPDYYTEVDLQNPQRIIRALEVSIFTNKPFSTFRSKTETKRSFDLIKIGLNMDRQELYSRINSRVDQMLETGLVEEVRTLLPYRQVNALNTVGYTELFDFFDGKVSLEQAVEAIKQNTRRFAKRQLTWFRKDQEFEWFHPDQTPDVINYINSRITPAR